MIQKSPFDISRLLNSYCVVELAMGLVTNLISNCKRFPQNSCTFVAVKMVFWKENIVDRKQSNIPTCEKGRTTKTKLQTKHQDKVKIPIFFRITTSCGI